MEMIKKVLRQLVKYYLMNGTNPEDSVEYGLTAKELADACKENGIKIACDDFNGYNGIKEEL